MSNEYLDIAMENPQQKTGHWIRFKEFENGYWHIRCSECGQYWSIDDHVKIFKHCFNCGARMIEQQESEDAKMSMITELVDRLRESADNTELDMECSLSCDGKCNKLLRECADVIEELSAKLQSANMNRSSQYYNGCWIPVSDRLPEKEGRYITTILNEHDNRLRYVMTCVYFSNGHWCPDDESASSNVIAWMPLPERYKEE